MAERVLLFVPFLAELIEEKGQGENLPLAFFQRSHKCADGFIPKAWYRWLFIV